MSHTALGQFTLYNYLSSSFRYYGDLKVMEFHTKYNNI